MHLLMESNSFHKIVPEILFDRMYGKHFEWLDVRLQFCSPFWRSLLKYRISTCVWCFIRRRVALQEDPDRVANFKSGLLCRLRCTVEHSAATCPRGALPWGYPGGALGAGGWVGSWGRVLGWTKAARCWAGGGAERLSPAQSKLHNGCWS